MGPFVVDTSRAPHVVAEDVGSITAQEAVHNMLRFRELAIDGGAIYARTERLQGGNQLDVNSAGWARDLARQLQKTSPLFQGILAALEMYTIGVNGLSVAFTGEKEAVRIATRYLNKWTERADIDWLPRCRELFRRTIRDGEALPRIWDDMALSWLEPEFVMPRDGTKEWTFGLLNQKGNTEKILAAYCNYGTDNEVVDAADFLVLKRNVDRCIKRGISDVMSLAPYLQHSQNLMLTMGEVEPIRQQYIALFLQRGGTQADANAMVASQTTYIDQHGGGVRHDHGGAREMILTGDQSVQGMPAPGNMSGALDVSNSLQLMAGQRYKMDLAIIAGVTDSNNTVNLGADSLFGAYIRAVEQPFLVGRVRELLWRIMELSEDEGLLPAGICDQVCLEVKPSQTFGVDPFKRTEQLALLNEHGILPDDDWAVLENLDPAKIVKKNSLRVDHKEQKANPADEGASNGGTAAAGTGGDGHVPSQG